MRLIDAEQLKQAVRKKFPELADRCEINELVNAAPTVDAIPLEWLTDKELNSERDLSCAAWQILSEWKQEQAEQE